MSKPTAGTYYIVNRVLSPSGEKLAITFNGQGNLATVTPLNNSATQRWVISDFDANTQAVSPVNGTNLQAGWGEGVVILPSGNYVWTIRSGNNAGYTIQDGGVTVFWGLNSAAVNSNIGIAAGRGDEKKEWIMQIVA